MTRVTLTTANTPGAVAILQLHGEHARNTLQQITGQSHWPMRYARLARFEEIDEGLAILLDDNAVQLMPHGGPRVVQRLIERLVQLGCVYDANPSTPSLYPEAGSAFEADMLADIARAASPAAIDLLAAQPALWRGLFQQAGELDHAQRQAIADRSRILNQLLIPPTVVVAGPANVGKSTLTNALMGKAVSIVADLPGTTRDWVGGLVELSSTSDASQAVAVHWLDTPGLRDSNDHIEQRAILLAKQQIDRADVVIAMRDPDQPWPQGLPHQADLYVVNKVDDADEPDASSGMTQDNPLAISAQQERNLDRLQLLVIRELGLEDISPAPWAFSSTLRDWCCSRGGQSLAEYLG